MFVHAMMRAEPRVWMEYRSAGYTFFEEEREDCPMQKVILRGNVLVYVNDNLQRWARNEHRFLRYRN
jgi:hypothetical protein